MVREWVVGMVVESVGFRVTQIRLVLTCYVTLGKIPNPSGSQFPHLPTRYINSGLPGSGG